MFLSRGKSGEKSGELRVARSELRGGKQLADNRQQITINENGEGRGKQITILFLTENRRNLAIRL
jgi:hypothetical protein